jgi:hypothetical protein
MMKLTCLILLLFGLILIPGVAVVPSHATSPIPWIAFKSGLDAGSIYRMRADGGQLQRLTTLSGYDSDPQWSGAVTPTVEPDLQQLVTQFAAALGDVPDSSAVYFTNTDAEYRFHERLDAAIADLLANPNLQSLNMEDLSYIVNEGVQRANTIPNNKIGRTSFYNMGPEDYILVSVGQLWCYVGSHHYTPTNKLTVFSRSGEFWSIDTSQRTEEYWLDDEWIVLADLTSSGISGEYHLELWQITQQSGSWRKIVVDTFLFPERASFASIGGNLVTLYVSRPVVEPPCEFTEEIQNSLDHMDGHFRRTYKKVNGVYTLLVETLVEVNITITRPNTEQYYYPLENWEDYCIG